MLHEGRRICSVLAAAALLFLLVMAVSFHVERTTVFDGAWQTWQLVIGKVPHAEHHRYSTMLSQSVALLLLALKAPLNAVLLAYSVSLIAVHLAGFWVLWSWLRQREQAIALVIGLVAMVGGSFYFGVSEVQQGASAPFLFWAFAQRMFDAVSARERVRWGSGVLLSTLWAAFYHMSFILLLLHSLMLEIIARRAWKNPWSWGMLLVTAGVFFLRNEVVGLSEYEQERMVHFEDVVRFGGDLSALPSTVHLLRVLPGFPAIWIVAGVTTIAALARLRWLSLLWTGAWTAGALLLILIADRSTGAPYMFENMYPIIGMAWAMSAASIWLNVPRRQGSSVLALALVLASGCWQIWRARHVPTDKVHYAERLTANLRARSTPKAIISAHTIPWNYAQTHWTLPFETALVSALHGPDSVVTVLAEEPMDKAGDCTFRTDRFLGPSWNFCMYGLEEIDTSYFKLPLGPYVFATALPDTADRTTDAGGYRLMALEPAHVMRSGPYDLVPVRIASLGVEGLKALGHGALNVVRCEVLSSDTHEVISSEWTSLETDLPAGQNQDLLVRVLRPERSGEHVIRLELLVDGQPTGVTDTMSLSVHSLGM